MNIKRAKSVKGPDPTFFGVKPGSAFKSIHGNIYIKLRTSSNYAFNAVSIENGQSVSFNQDTTIIPLPNAVLIENELEE